MLLNQLLTIARQRGEVIEAVDRNGKTVRLLEYACNSTSEQIPTHEEAMMGFFAANVIDPQGNAEYVTEVMLPGLMLERLKEVEMRHVLEVGLTTLRPHLPDMLEAFPELKIFAARSLELLDNNQAAIVACYGTYQHPDSELDILKGFGAMGCLSYAEVEKWRYKEIPIPQ